MEGKKNIVFGLIYFIATAALGLYMTMGLMGPAHQAEKEKAQKMSQLEQGLQSGFMTGEPGTINGEALMALNEHLKAEGQIGSVAGGPHAHGNLESMLNVVIGILLMFLAVPSALKQVISWLFIIGAVFHSGMLYLDGIFGMGWAYGVMGFQIGPIALLAGLALAAIATLMGLTNHRQP